MKSDRTNSLQHRKIKREHLQRSPPLGKNGQPGLGIDHTIHIRRHSVMVGSNRHGILQKANIEMRAKEEQP